MQFFRLQKLNRNEPRTTVYVDVCSHDVLEASSAASASAAAAATAAAAIAVAVAPAAAAAATALLLLVDPARCFFFFLSTLFRQLYMMLYRTLRKLPGTNTDNTRKKARHSNMCCCCCLLCCSWCSDERIRFENEAMPTGV